MKLPRVRPPVTYGRGRGRGASRAVETWRWERCGGGDVGERDAAARRSGGNGVRGRRRALRGRCCFLGRRRRPLRSARCGVRCTERRAAEATELRVCVASAATPRADAHLRGRWGGYGGNGDDSRRRDGPRSRLLRGGDRHGHRAEAVAARDTKPDAGLVPGCAPGAGRADGGGSRGVRLGWSEVEGGCLGACGGGPARRGRRLAGDGRPERVGGRLRRKSLRRRGERRERREARRGGRRSDAWGEALAALLAEHEVPRIVPPARCADHALRMGHPRRPRRQVVPTSDARARSLSGFALRR